MSVSSVQFTFTLTVHLSRTDVFVLVFLLHFPFTFPHTPNLHSHLSLEITLTSLRSFVVSFVDRNTSPRDRSIISHALFIRIPQFALMSRSDFSPPKSFSFTLRFHTHIALISHSPAHTHITLVGPHTQITLIGPHSYRHKSTEANDGWTRRVRWVSNESRSMVRKIQKG